MMKNKLLLIAAGGVLCVVSGAALAYVFDFAPEGAAIVSAFRESAADISAEEKKTSSTTSLLFVGDIMLDRGVRSRVMKFGGGDFSFPFLPALGTLRGADLLFGNLEGPLSDKGEEAGKVYSFRMPPESIDGLLAAGFDILSLANNHADDWGREAIADTNSRLALSGIVPVGAGVAAEAYAPKFIEKNGVKFAFLAYVDFRMLEALSDKPGVAIAREKKIEEGIAIAKRDADVVVVSFHFGEEYVATPTPRQIELARFAIDRGADLVVGHHPHVAGPLETYGGKYIAYSLGNFVFDQYFSEETMQGVALEVGMLGNDIVSARLLPIKINANFQAEFE